MILVVVAGAPVVVRSGLAAVGRLLVAVAELHRTGSTAERRRVDEPVIVLRAQRAECVGRRIPAEQRPGEDGAFVARGVRTSEAGVEAVPELFGEHALQPRGVPDQRSIEVDRPPVPGPERVRSESALVHEAHGRDRQGIGPCGVDQRVDGGDVGLRAEGELGRLAKRARVPRDGPVDAVREPFDLQSLASGRRTVRCAIGSGVVRPRTV